MRINSDQVVLDYDGKPIEVPALGANGVDGLTLRRIITQALNSVSPGDKPLNAEQKLRAFQISVRASNPGKPLDLKVEDMAFIKERVSAAYTSPLIYGRVCEVFDGPETEE